MTSMASSRDRECSSSRSRCVRGVTSAWSIAATSSEEGGGKGGAEEKEEEEEVEENAADVAV